MSSAHIALMFVLKLIPSEHADVLQSQTRTLDQRVKHRNIETKHGDIMCMYVLA